MIIVGRRRKTNNRSRNVNRDGIHPVTTGSADNDPSWYLVNGQMAKDVLSIPTTLQNGFPISIGQSTQVTTAFPSYVSTPGVMTFDVIPVIPTGGPFANGQTGQVAINMAASSLYQAIQSKNSRTPSYEAADLMLYIIGLTSALSYYQFLVRLYGVVSNFSYDNRYTPEALIKAQYCDYDNIHKHLANFRTGINQIAAALMSFYLPKSIDYSNRQIFLYESIYTDSTSAKAQYYMYAPLAFWQWIEGKEDDPHSTLTHLDLLQFRNGSLYSYDELLEYGWSLIEPLRDSEDIRMIGADLINAFGMGSMYTVSPIAETFQVKPLYNKEVMMQFENAFINPAFEWFTNTSGNHSSLAGSLVQDGSVNGGNLTCSVEYTSNTNWIRPSSANYSTNLDRSNYILNFHEDNVTSEMMLVASRVAMWNKFSAAKAGSAAPMSNLSLIKPYNYQSTEIIAGATLWYFDPQSGMSLNNQQLSTVNLISAWDGASVNTAALLSRFDWQPAFYWSPMNSTDGSLTEPLFDLDNYVLVPENLLANVNYMCILGLFTPKQLDSVARIK